MASYGYGYGGYGYGYASYGYGGYGYGGGYYSIHAGAYDTPYIYLSGPGSSGYYAYYEGSTKFINSAYESYYGGRSDYAATLSPDGDFIQTSYNYSSGSRTDSEATTYMSHSSYNTNAYYGYSYHQSSADYQSVDVATSIVGEYRYFDEVSYQSTSFFDGSYSHSYSDTTLTEYDGKTVPGSSHTYSSSSYTDPTGYTTYHSSQT